MLHTLGWLINTKNQVVTYLLRYQNEYDSKPIKLFTFFNEPQLLYHKYLLKNNLVDNIN